MDSNSSSSTIGKQLIMLQTMLQTLTGRIKVLEAQNNTRNLQMKQQVNNKQIKRRMSSSRRRRRPSASDMSKLLEQQEALRVHVEDFQKDLDMNDIELLDELYEKECLTEAEYDSIRSRRTPCDKGRLLIVKMKDSAPIIIDTFLTLLEARPAYKHLSIKVKETLAHIQAESRNMIKCVICAMKECVDIHDIIDHLYKENIISGVMYTDIAEQENLACFRQYVWDHILKAVEKEEDRQHGIKILKESLSMKYRHVSSMLENLPINAPLVCCCVKRRGLRSRPPDDAYGSSTDVSTTSEVPRGDRDSVTEPVSYASDTDAQEDDTVFENSDCPTPQPEGSEIFLYDINVDKDMSKTQHNEVSKHGIDFVESQKSKTDEVRYFDIALQADSLSNVRKQIPIPSKQSHVKTETPKTAVAEKQTSPLIKSSSSPHLEEDLSNRTTETKEAEEAKEDDESRKVFQKVKKELKLQVNKLRNSVTRASSLPSSPRRIIIRKGQNNDTARKQPLPSSSSDPDILSSQRRLQHKPSTKINSLVASQPKTSVEKENGDSEVNALGLVEQTPHNGEDVTKVGHTSEGVINASTKSPSNQEEVSRHRPRTSSIPRRTVRRRRSRSSPRRQGAESQKPIAFESAGDNQSFVSKTNINVKPENDDRGHNLDMSDNVSKPSTNTKASASMTKETTKGGQPKERKLPNPPTISYQTDRSEAYRVDSAQASPSYSDSNDEISQSSPNSTASAGSVIFRFDCNTTETDEIEFNKNRRLSKIDFETLPSKSKSPFDLHVSGELRRTQSLPKTENLTSFREGRKRKLLPRSSSKNRGNLSERRKSEGAIRAGVSYTDIESSSTKDA